MRRAFHAGRSLGQRDHPQLGISQYWDRGSVPGFAGGIDLDIARTDFAAVGRSAGNTQEDDMPCFGRTAEAGTNQHADLAVVGCTKLRIHTSFGNVVDGRAILFYKDTGGNGNGGGTGGG
jgi:hypothetical protein